MEARGTGNPRGGISEPAGLGGDGGMDKHRIVWMRRGAALCECVSNRRVVRDRDSGGIDQRPHEH